MPSKPTDPPALPGPPASPGVPPLPAGTPPSPCVSQCQMDQARQVCLGCLRTLDEIVAWGQAGDDYKRAVWAALPQRRALRGAA